MMIWGQFFIGAAIIVFSGIRLTAYADELSEKINLGKLWIGVVLLGFVTSMPEAITTLVAVISIKANDLAIGNIVGSNNFNPILIVVMDLFYRGRAITNDIKPERSHTVSALTAVLLTLVVIFEILLNKYYQVPALGTLSLGSILIIIIYFSGMRYLAVLGMSPGNITEAVAKDRDSSLIQIWINLIFSAILVTVGAVWLTDSADAIAQQTGLGHTFVGSIFLALVTSLPEMVVSISALRIKQLDLAIGNIFGSNMTNIFIVSVCDLFYQSGSILNNVSSTHIFTACLSIVLTFILLIGIRSKNKRCFMGMGIDSLFMLVCFLAGTVMLYHLK